MSAVEPALPTLNDVLPAPLRVGAPDVHGPLAVFPLFGPPPVVEYVAFADGCARGVVVKELADAAPVNDLVVVNPTRVAVLLYEGEEVLGAQQNRTFDVSVLVPAGASVRVPVSCVEHGRWEGARHGEAFSPAPQAAYPSLRRMTNAASSARVAAGLEARAEQGAVWAEVAAKAERLDVDSRTDAMHDIYEGRRDALHAFAAAVSLRDGQTGALAAIGGRIAVLDHVSRPDAFAALHRPLVQGYALDALDAATDGVSPAARSLDDAGAFVAALGAARRSVAPLGGPRATEHDGIGPGRDVPLGGPGVSGAGLVAGAELIQ